MWGFKENETPQNVSYMGESLKSKYRRPELWLRSDLSRLLELFNVAIPAQIDLYGIEREFAELKHEYHKQERVVKNLNLELKMR